MLHESLNYKIRNVHKKEDSRAILINLDIEDVSTTLCCIYAPNDQKNRSDFFKNLKFWITRNSDSPENTIIGGDFNCALNENDRVNEAGNKDPSRNDLKSLLKSLKLDDTWFIKNNQPQYTYTDPVNNSKSRIDYIFTSADIKYKIKKIRLKHVPKKDKHKAVILKINLSDNKRGPGHWKMNAKLFDMPEYENMVKDINNDCLFNYPELDWRTKWDLLKLQVQDGSILLGTQRAKKRKEYINNMQSKIDNLNESESKGIEVDMNEKIKLEKVI